MKTSELRTFGAAISLTAILGSAACTPAMHDTRKMLNTSSTTPCEKPSSFTDIHLIGADKAGTTNAVNSGECAAVYDTKTLQTVGTIGHQAAFTIVCYDGPKPDAFRVVGPGNIHGDVNLGTAMMQQENKGDFAEIIACDPSAPA